MSDPATEFAVKLTGEQIDLLLKITGPRIATGDAERYGDWSVDLDRRLRSALESEEHLAKLDPAERAFVNELAEQFEAYLTGTSGDRSPVARWWHAVAEKLDPACPEEQFIEEILARRAPDE